MAGALVRLLPDAGGSGLTRLTGPEGRFRIDAPGPGRFRLVGEVIGYRTEAIGPFDLAAGETIEIDLALTADPLRLEGLTVSAERRCDLTGDAALVIERVWRDIRTALETSLLIEQDPGALFHVELSERRTEARTGEVTRSSRRKLNVKGAHPFRSLAVDDLVEGGFVREEGAATLYFAPDARALLSDAFLETHCFGLDAEAGQVPRVGLAFWPVPGRGRPDIAGTLWLDPVTLRLDELEYSYWEPGAPLRHIGPGRPRTIHGARFGRLDRLVVADPHARGDGPRRHVRVGRRASGS